MTSEVEALFSQLRAQLWSAFPDVIEIAETRSISYHDPEFLLEVIPRKRELSLLVAIEYNELEESDAFVFDASDYNFIVHASHHGGVLIKLQDNTLIERSMGIISRARNLLLSG